MVLRELRRLLERAGFRVSAKQVQMTLSTDLHGLAIPAAFVYVIDASGPAWATEAMATAIRLHHPAARLLVVGQHFTEVSAFPLFYLGVRGLVRYAEIHKQLPKALRSVAKGGFWAPRDLVTSFVESLLGAKRGRAHAGAERQVSKREGEVLACLLKNLPNKEISSRLHIAESTVKFHVSNILAKFGVQRRTDLILRFFQEHAA